MPKDQVITGAEELVISHMLSNDPSHDYFHVDRVRRTALRLARALKEEEKEEEGMDLEVVELVALFHDLAAKYAAKNKSPSLSAILSPFFHDLDVSPSTRTLILEIIPLISWSMEKFLRAEGRWASEVKRIKKMKGWGILRCVQDADRLDAIGAFGILRVAAYSSAVDRPLHVGPFCPDGLDSATMDDEEDAHQKMKDESSIQHFHDKLLLVKDRLKTPLGKKEGKKRHETMVRFLADIEDEFVDDESAEDESTEDESMEDESE